MNPLPRRALYTTDQVELHHVIGLHFGRLIQRSKFDLLGRLSIVDEGRLDAVQIVRTDGDQGSITAEILMELLLEFDETLIAVRVELNVAKHGTDNDRANALRLERRRSCSTLSLFRRAKEGRTFGRTFIRIIF